MTENILPLNGNGVTKITSQSGLHDSQYSSIKNDQKKPVKVSIIIPTDAYFVSGIRDFTMTIVRNMTGFSKQWAYRFQSAVDELTNNAIEYGSAPGKDIKVTFVSLKGERIEVYVSDTGTGPSKKTATEMMKLIKERKKINPVKINTLRGRGLAQIVSKWTDRLEFSKNSNGGLTAHVVKKLEPKEQINN